MFTTAVPETASLRRPVAHSPLLQRQLGGHTLQELVKLQLQQNSTTRVQRMPCPTNTSVRIVFFWDLIHEVPGLHTELMEYRTPTNTAVRTVFFEDFVVRWTWGRGGCWGSTGCGAPAVQTSKHGTSGSN